MFVTPSYMAFYHEGRIRKDVQVREIPRSIHIIISSNTQLADPRSRIPAGAHVREYLEDLQDYDWAIESQVDSSRDGRRQGSFVCSISPAASTNSLTCLENRYPSSLYVHQQPINRSTLNYKHNAKCLATYSMMLLHSLDRMQYVFLGFRDFDTTLSTLQSNLQTAKLSDLASASDSSRNLVRAFPEHLQPVRSGSNASLSSSSSLPRLAASLSSGAVHADGSSSSLLSRTISPGESPAVASSSASSRSKRMSVSTPVPSTSIRASTTALSSNPDEVIAIEAPVVLVGTPGTSDGASESTSEALSRPANAEEDSVTTVSTDLDSFEDEPDMNLEVFEPDSTLPMEFASIYDLSIAGTCCTNARP